MRWLASEMLDYILAAMLVGGVVVIARYTSHNLVLCLVLTAVFIAAMLWLFFKGARFRANGGQVSGDPRRGSGNVK